MDIQRILNDIDHEQDEMPYNNWDIIYATKDDKQLATDEHDFWSHMESYFTAINATDNQ